jgi:hypothetical protein
VVAGFRIFKVSPVSGQLHQGTAAGIMTREGRNMRSIIIAAILCAVPAFVRGQRPPSLALRPEILESRYCLERSGLTTLHVRLRLEFKNNGEVPVILLGGTPVLGFTLRSGNSETAKKFPRQRIMDASKENSPTPDPAIAVVIQPGESSLREDEILIPLRAASKAAPPLGTEQDLTIKVDPWPDKRRRGESLRRRWARSGFLWLEPVDSSAVRLRIERSPRFGSCSPQTIF